MSASTSQPDGDGGLPIPEDPFGGGRIQPFGQRSSHDGDLVGRGFQPVQGGVAPGSERGTAGLTTKGLDALETAMLAIAHQRMYVCIGDAKVGAISVGTGEALGVYALGSSPPTDCATR